MKPSFLYRIVLLGMALWLAACSREVSISTANIADARLSKDEAGAQTTTTFGPEDVFYLKVGLANAPDDTKVKAAWTAVAVEGAEASTPLDDVELTSGSATLTFDLANTNPWPAGDYKVDIYLNGALDRSLDFRVSGGLARAATATPAEPAATATSEPVAASLAVDSLQEVKSATVQIVGQGTFVDPEVGTQYNLAGSGSGFIIDESGIAVTNNHVVTGAALIRVYVGGESQPRNARILGVSECADLAVIDIEGAGYPYLEWYDDTVNVGLDVYAAGFPLGDPEFTLTRGIVSKARTGGKTDWASVAAVIEHDATINPGNSGGPLVTPDGKVVAVNYAGANDVGQFFAIAQPQALPVIEQLSQGEDVLAIGVNGTAINDGEGLSGIWVSSVKSGSPASRAGVKGGDIITRLEGLVLATDGTLGDYCDILRTRGSEDVLAIEVLRFDTEEVLEGELNGRALETSFSFAQELTDEATTADTEAAAAESYDNYVAVNDDTGTLTMEVPVEWSDVDGSAWLLDGEEIGLSLTAATSVADFNNTWDTPGAFFGVSDQFDLTTDELLDSFDYSDDCTYDSRSEYSDSVYTGSYDLWTNCGETGSSLVVVGVQPEDASYLALVLVQVVGDADLDALDRIMNTFIFVP
ncbi:MAG TPA: trypsin-like peptidase domain-containing protein [Anaerolineae bacterium]|nr:trypsin-like peptidase domain-containing protein [Anaerolineae bacterium]